MSVSPKPGKPETPKTGFRVKRNGAVATRLSARTRMARFDARAIMGWPNRTHRGPKPGKRATTKARNPGVGRTPFALSMVIARAGRKGKGPPRCAPGGRWPSGLGRGRASHRTTKAAHLQRAMLCWLHRIALVASVGRDITRGRRAAGERSDFAAIGCSRLTDVAHPAKF